MGRQLYFSIHFVEYRISMQHFHFLIKTILIFHLQTADVNFAADLSDLRHRKKFSVVLIHSRRVSEALKICATKSIVYEELVKDIPKRQAEVVSLNLSIIPVLACSVKSLLLYD